MNAIETLISVLCDPEGKCCISGSDDDRRLIDSALAELAQAAQADSVQEDAARLDFLIDQGAYVVSDPDTCTGHWLHWAMPDGSTRVQGDEHPTPRAAIDAARKQGEKQ